MFPSLSAYYHHSEKYSNVLSELEFEYAFAKTDKKRFDLLKKFSDNFLMPIELWVLVKELIPKLKLQSDTLHDKALYNFCNDPRVTKNMVASRYILLQDNRPLWPSLQSLSFPHSKLDQDLMAYEQHANKPLSAKELDRIENLKMLFWEIKAKQDNVEEWFDALTEADNIKFLKVNVEHRLSFHLWDKVLWKLYIKYLEKHDTYEMFRVYSNYCRFFLNDNDMIREYKAKLKKHGDIGVPWKNRYKNEKPSSKPIHLPLYKFVSDEDDDDDDDEEDYFLLEKINKKFKLQDWPFPSPIIRYMIFGANSTVLQKLHRTCKYFFIKMPKLFCFKFMCSSFGPQSVKYTNQSLNSSFLIYHSNPTICTRLINNVIVECTAKHVELIFQSITPKELNMLIGHGNVEYLNLDQTTIEDEKENGLLLEDILKMVPKIKWFACDSVVTSSNTFKIVSEMHFMNKFLHFNIGVIENTFDFNDFSKFIKKNAALFSVFTFTFEGAAEMLPGYKEIIDNSFDETPIEGKPNIILKN